MQKIQTDVFSLPASQIVPLLVNAGEHAGGESQRMAEALKQWDYNVKKESAAAGIYEVALSSTIRTLLARVLTPELQDMYQHNFSSTGRILWLSQQLEHPEPSFFPGKTEAERLQQRDALLAEGLAAVPQAMQALTGSKEISDWTWGKLHTAHFDHPLIYVWPLQLLFDIAPVPTDGDVSTVNTGGDGGFTARDPDYNQYLVAAMRQIVDLSDFDTSSWIITVGQSGQPWSDHYADQVPLWQKGAYIPMFYSRDAVLKSTQKRLELQA
jgi:penicillin amidase